MNNSNQVTNANLFSNTSRLGTYIIVFLWFLFYAIGFFRVARREKIKNAWLAWIPFGQFYLLGQIVQKKSKIPFLGIILLLSQLILAFFFSFINLNLTSFLIYLVILIIFYCIYQYAFNLFYKIVDPDRSFLYLVLGILFPFLIPIWVLALSKEKKPDDFYMN